MSQDPESQEPLLSLTEGAMARLLEVRDDDPQPERLVLRLAVSGEASGEYTYEMYFQLREAVTPHDVLLRSGDLEVAVPEDHLQMLSGAEIDASDEGWSIDNPNRPRPTIGTPLPIVPTGPSSPAVGAAVPEGLRDSLSGDVAQRVLTVLEEHVNRAIAAHGGRVDLAGVEGSTAYVTLAGGCQGCGMATVTLSQGIEVAIMELVPEITKVVDVTDHASGTNPYFEPSKK